MIYSLAMNMSHQTYKICPYVDITIPSDIIIQMTTE